MRYIRETYKHANIDNHHYLYKIPENHLTNLQIIFLFKTINKSKCKSYDTFTNY